MWPEEARVILNSNSEEVPVMTLTVTRVPDACMLLDFGGRVLRTDPWFSERRGYTGVSRWCSPRGPGRAGVLVSHGHYDHFDMAAFAAYPDHAVPFIVKRGLAGRVRQAGFATALSSAAPMTQATILEPGRPFTVSGAEPPQPPGLPGR